MPGTPKEFFSTDPLYDPEEVPPHLDGTPPGRLPTKLWKEMTEQQRLDYTKWVRGYLAELEEERRQERKRGHGY
jgi:hypothetical protein